MANCNYIAVLLTIAWSWPYRIAQQTLAIGTSQNQFYIRVSFYRPGANGRLDL